MKEKSFLKLVLFSLLTCGIYGIIFWYSFNEDVNQMSNGLGRKNTNYILMVVFTVLTCGIYYFIWLYRLADNIQIAGQSKYNIQIKEGGSTIVLWSFLGSMLCGIGQLVGLYILIENFNKLARAYNSEM